MAENLFLYFVFSGPHTILEDCNNYVPEINATFHQLIINYCFVSVHLYSTSARSVWQR